MCSSAQRKSSGHVQTGNEKRPNFTVLRKPFLSYETTIFPFLIHSLFLLFCIHLYEFSRNFTLAANANFYSLSTSSIASAVHIPTPLYDRNPELLRKIEWSEIDEVYRTHREETRDLAFQLFCSESGYMRFFPGKPPAVTTAAIDILIF
ncbi:VWA protein [Ancylostoma caninum]|uniref:VWA protein n=1 Tax=Ancylostoma caninum TaxID=29170 RepID=A0A368FYT9_ANCCA|nr:VWA protein [Ancylostoma caninum]